MGQYVIDFGCENTQVKRTHPWNWFFLFSKKMSHEEIESNLHKPYLRKKAIKEVSVQKTIIK